MAGLQSNLIRFYRVGDEYGEFSNFAPFPITIDGVTWPTSEHYFQAQKFSDPAVRETIRLEPSPMNAAKLGRSREFAIRPDWEVVKDDVMRRAVRAKFTEHAELQALLVGTGTADIVEHTSNDSYWADGGDG